MANIKHFNGETELKGVHYQGRKLFGQPVDFTPVFVPGIGWNRGYVPVERSIEYKSNPSKHVCDARCYNATGRIMKCECSCGGKNHGKGAFNCEAA
jgi:hypothetical protein